MNLRMFYNQLIEALSRTGPFFAQRQEVVSEDEWEPQIEVLTQKRAQEEAADLVVNKERQDTATLVHALSEPLIVIFFKSERILTQIHERHNRAGSALTNIDTQLLAQIEAEIQDIYAAAKRIDGELKALGGTSGTPLPERLDVSTTSQGNEVILVVDDDESVGSVIQDILGSRGYTVLVRRNAHDILQFVEDPRQAIDLLVTDIVMPVKGGIELAEEVRRIRPDVKVLYVSGYPDQNSIVRIETRGTAFLQKPFTAGLLEYTVRQLLDRRSLSAGA